MAQEHCVGVITDNCDNPLKYGYIVIERTNEDYSHRGELIKYKTNKIGQYDFYIKGGYYNIYTQLNKDATRDYLGSVHVVDSKGYQPITIEELIANDTK